MEVYSATWKGQRVAVKRMKRESKPVRSNNLTPEQDTAYLLATREFYTDVKNIMQEVLIMSRVVDTRPRFLRTYLTDLLRGQEPLCMHRNIVRLLAVSWDETEEENTSALFPPLLVVELAHHATPTLQAYYRNPMREESFLIDIGFIADIGDGLYAMHTCGVIHGDLKPENILLFKDPEREGPLVAKICDFGFASIPVVDEVRRGRSWHWAAPEYIEGCPENIRQLAETAASAGDVYSFGLVAMFIALHGSDPLDFQGVSAEGIEELKFRDEARFMIGEKITAQFSAVDSQEFGAMYKSLINETLQSIPSKRIESLDGVRLRITGKYDLLFLELRYLRFTEMSCATGINSPGKKN
jgi:serine/threonine protein kinase